MVSTVYKAWIRLLQEALETPQGDCLNDMNSKPHHSAWTVALLANLFEVHCVLTSCSRRIWVLLPFNKTVMWGKVEGRRRGWQRMRWLGGITDSVYMSLSKLGDIYSEGQGSLVCCSSCSHKESDTTEWVNSSHHLYMVKERQGWC